MRRALLILSIVSFSSCVIINDPGTTGGGSGGSSGGTGGTGGSSGGGGMSGGMGGGGMLPGGNITFLWSFGGANCTVAQVATVKISMPGQTLSNGGVYNCENGGVAGIVLNAFAAGSYTWTIEGKDSGGTTRYQKAGSVTVNGDVQVVVSLDSVGGTARLTWTFPPNAASQNPTCSQAGVSDVNVSIDSAAPYSVPCAEGQTAQGSVTPALALGSHTIALEAVNAMGYGYYAKTGTLPITATPTVQQYDLDWSVGGVALSWTLSDGVNAQSCATAGITSLYVNFRDAQNQFVYAGAGDQQPCAAGSVIYNFLKPGTYAVFIQGVGTGNAMYRSNTTTPPSVLVTAGQFPMSGGPNVVVTKM